MGTWISLLPPTFLIWFDQCFGTEHKMWEMVHGVVFECNGWRIFSRSFPHSFPSPLILLLLQLIYKLEGLTHGVRLDPLAKRVQFVVQVLLKPKTLYHFRI